MILSHHSFGVGHPHLSVSRVREAHLLEKVGFLVPEFVGSVSKQFIRILLRLLSMSFSSIILPLLVVRVCLARSSSRVSVVVQDAFGVCLTRFASLTASVGGLASWFTSVTAPPTSFAIHQKPWHRVSLSFFSRLALKLS